MPNYEYQCDKCGDRFEVRQKFADEPLATHEKCGGPVHRLISVPALQFKGTGWYVTDYAKGSKSGGNGGSSHTDSSDKASKSESSDKKEPSASSKESSSSSSGASSEKSSGGSSSSETKSSS